MTLRQLILRNLRYYRRTNAVVVFGLAIASAVIIGSLLIGDSIKGSLLNTATSRLGHIDDALTSPGLFRADLSKYLANSSTLTDKVKHITPALLVKATAENADTELVLPNVSIVGIDKAFAKLYPKQAPLHLTGRQAVINTTLANELGVKAGDSIILNLDKQSAIPSGTLFSHQLPSDTQTTLRLEVSAVIGDQGLGGFRLDNSVEVPRNIFISADWLATAIGKQGMANTLLVQQETSSEDITPTLQTSLQSACRIEDHGLKMVSNKLQSTLSLQSDSLVFSDRQLEAAQAAITQCRFKENLTSIYLATEIRNISRNGASISYAIVSGLKPSVPFSFASGGSAEPESAGIWLNSWAAQDLKTRVGDILELSYLVPMKDGSYHSFKLQRTLTGIVNITGPAADKGLVPDFEGMTNTKSIEDWKTPFPVDLRSVTERDDLYWAKYSTTPKAYVNLSTTKLMWSAASTDNGWITSIRIPYRAGTDPTVVKAMLERAILANLLPEESGLVFRPVRRLAVESAQGNTDFGQLFLVMSSFIIIAGASLAATLLKLSSERRAAEIGTMLVCGFRPATAMQVLLGEGSMLALAGALLGLPLGIMYAWGVVSALKLWWTTAVGTSFLSISINPVSLLVGTVSALGVGLLAVWLAVRRLRNMQVLQLISGWQSLGTHQNNSSEKRSLITLAVCVVLTLVLLAVSMSAAVKSAEALLFCTGAVMLVGSIAGVNVVLIRLMHRRFSIPSIGKLALRSMSANRSRSLLIVGLMAAAAFTIITVAASTRDFSRMNYTDRNSGTGGFALKAVATQPIPYDLNSPKTRADLGFIPEDERSLKGVKFVSFLANQGDDISCLNPAKVAQPRVLGVSPQMISRGGFGAKADGENSPWRSLNSTDLDFEWIPVIGDADTVIWNIHSGLDQTTSLQGSGGDTHKARFTALLPRSIFASELLISEHWFKKLFPEVHDPRYFLVDVPSANVKAVTEVLRRNLGRLGFDIKSTQQVLNSYMGVQNTYLSMFLALGGLGMVLGTVGLVIVLLRSALERQKEFALMLAQGFRRSDIVRLLLIENIWLLLTGLTIGAVSALVSVIPALTGIESVVNWSAIGVIFTCILTTGVVCCVLAARQAVSGILIEVLHGE
ncbi:MAG: FtsX-like permease family protein [Armatimonadota bacterium]